MSRIEELKARIEILRGAPAQIDTYELLVSHLEAEVSRRGTLLYCAGIGLSLACEGGISTNLLHQLWIDPHGLRTDIANALGSDPLKLPENQRSALASQKGEG